MKVSTYVILTLISVAFSVLLYLGLIRYIRLHMINPQNQAEKYKSLKYPTKHVKTVATTAAETVDSPGLKASLNSLLDQTVRVDLIVVNVPENIRKDMPPWLRMCSIVGMAGDEYDCGGLCTIPTLLREKEADTILIVVEPGYVHGKDFIQTVLEAYEEHGEKPLATKHAIIAKTNQFKPELTISEIPLKLKWGDLVEYLAEPAVEVKYTETYPALGLLFPPRN